MRFILSYSDSANSRFLSETLSQDFSSGPSGSDAESSSFNTAGSTLPSRQNAVLPFGAPLGLILLPGCCARCHVTTAIDGATIEDWSVKLAHCYAGHCRFGRDSIKYYEIRLYRYGLTAASIVPMRLRVESPCAPIFSDRDVDFA